MSLRTTLQGLLALILTCQLNVASAQVLLDQAPDGNDHMWDCWISNDNGHSVISYLIRCIRDRDITPLEPAPDSTQAVLLDLIHDRIHRNETLEIERDLVDGRFKEILSHIWRIRIHQYPYESSWEQHLPQQLVQSMLCKTQPDCSVLLFR